MFGLPGENLETMRATFEFATSHLFEYVNFYEAKPYPGSQWYKDIDASKNWDDYNQYGKQPLKFRDMAFQYYFTYVKYIKMIQRKFGNQAVEQIGEMLKSGRPTTNSV
jgi:radical SAM superfamily enzyme YgiQ (UPF0313 family)